MGRKKKTGTCAFCGIEGIVTDDHIPPRCVFPEETTNDYLLTVPACLKCNGGTSSADEEFKIFTSLKTRSNTKSSDSLAASVRRTIINNNRLSTQLRRAKPFYLPINGGRDFKKFGLVDFKTEAIKGTLSKIARGLYWYHFGKPVPNEFTVDLFGESFSSESNRQKVEETIDEIRAKSDPFGTGEHYEFTYAYATIDKSDQTAWTFEFYQRAKYLVFVHKNQIQQGV